MPTATGTGAGAARQAFIGDLWLGGQLQLQQQPSIWTDDAALSAGAGDAWYAQDFGSSTDVLSSRGVGDVQQYQVDGSYPNTTSFNTPFLPEFYDPTLDLNTYLQPDLYAQESTSTSPFTISPLEHTIQTPIFPAPTPTTSSNSSSVQVSPLPPPSMEYYSSEPSPPPRQNKNGNDPTVVLKRQRNTLAARKYRQKRIDRITELEDAVDKLKSERDELRIKLARQEAETAALKEMLRAKAA